MLTNSNNNEMTLSDIQSIVINKKRLTIDSRSLELVNKSYNFLSNFSKDKVIYGINTGFGPMAQYRIADDELQALQYNIIRSHASGAGKPLDEIYVRAAMLARLRTFAIGKSGVHIDTLNILKEFINRNICPFIPEHGSVGASGDLVQLSQLALTLIGEGEVFYKGEKRSTVEVLKEEGIAPLNMYLREGLALVNGTAVMTGIGLINLIYAKQLLYWSLIASTMMNEIASSYDDFMSEELNILKLHRGQQEVAKIMRELSVGSQCLQNREAELYEQKNTETIFDKKVQPYYSLRCVPQILGPVFDEIENAEKVLINELNSVDDNPIIDVETKTVYHGGNFHGDYISYEMDKLKIAITKLTMLTERQLNYLFHDKINGILPPFVNLGKLGLNYGLQGAQFTATSTTAECQTLSNPMCVHSIPNNNDNQDVVSMGTNSALIAKHVIENSFQVMAIHFMALAQAVDCLEIADKLAPTSRKTYNEIRALVPVFVEDTPKYKEIERMAEFLKNQQIKK